MAKPVTIALTATALVLTAGVLPSAISPISGVAAAQTDEGDVKKKRENLALMLRPVTISFNDQRLEDVMTFLKDFTGAEMDVHYIDDRKPDALDPDTLITLDVKDMSALRLLERVLEQAAKDSFQENTWQMTSWGSIECGPKSLLNRRQRVVIYDISDLLFEIPDYQDAPRIDLQSALQSNQGGGGQSPFDGDTNDDNEEIDREAARNEVIDLIQTIVEPEQWVDNGGDGGNVNVFQNTLVIRAPDYMHRQIDGYSWWPTQSTRIAGTGARRYVSFTLDTGIGTVDGFAQQPVTAVVGGGNGGNGGNGGGGGGGGG
ncbi:MAG: hypothetical protein ED559_10645 [Phycisphaera sp.]|nr:MAG: hypothetical protein ED559_10645 [Phycisphaera sp.]